MLSKKTPEERLAQEVNSLVQGAHMFALLPRILFTWAMFLFIPTVWFHAALNWTGLEPLAIVAWLIGLPAAAWSGRLVPDVPVELTLAALTQNQTGSRP